MIKVIALFFITTLLFSCSPRFQNTLERNFSDTEIKFQDHTGFSLYDIDAGKTVFEYKADRYFTPASNTKILTFYTCLTILNDSLPAFKYKQSTDSLIVWTMGDPTFLNNKIYNNPASFDFLKNTEGSLYLSSTNFYEEAFGSGWAWDDFNGSYQPEKSAFPIYSNLVTATFDSSILLIEPAYFANSVSIAEEKRNPEFIREKDTNHFTFHPSQRIISKTFETPFRTSDSLTRLLLQDTLKKPVAYINAAMPFDVQTFFNTPVDSVYKVMMQESDNFLAEQLLLMCSATISDSLSVGPAMRLMQQSYLSDLPDKLRWVDGSGLSRYNLFTPRSIVAVWKKIYQKVPRERLFPLLATGGVNGTVANWYKSEQPYFYGKTGTLANNHSLSGYLITRSGKTLIFSFMNSHYLASTSDIRRNMQSILEYIRDNYK
ncbi:D-alanyl-D-alanine carboxypeptidase/D-alanyl-D-alanine-endopeptidase [Chryseotalea sanaruensis]|uniref:D-alanyl-D-alanine carboxypeptidase/D-alanyl-D-alanine-endopeptidase n=1 Tax=Chryseotalea sanaruensis TaxID=2482724 RepID=A0A401U7S0_9BACT|nr:D-alanyl-D-alanine carboxypeptidase [Chryseotalea sanaruensis]GCC50925.1 D-alanyl-D-alanine carboxypeptidase/D-alanyl-D-alanine-endopeptidase [Chryseotalea sanaruensis]